MEVKFNCHKDAIELDKSKTVETAVLSYKGKPGPACTKWET